MHISVNPTSDKTTIVFDEESIIISKDDAQQLRELLILEEGGSFETD